MNPSCDLWNTATAHHWRALCLRKLSIQVQFTAGQSPAFWRYRKPSGKYWEKGRHLFLRLCSRAKTNHLIKIKCFPHTQCQHVPHRSDENHPGRLQRQSDNHRLIPLLLMGLLMMKTLLHRDASSSDAAAWFSGAWGSLFSNHKPRLRQPPPLVRAPTCGLDRAPALLHTTCGIVGALATCFPAWRICAASKYRQTYNNKITSLAPPIRSGGSLWGAGPGRQAPPSEEGRAAWSWQTHYSMNFSITAIPHPHTVHSRPPRDHTTNDSHHPTHAACS